MRGSVERELEGRQVVVELVIEFWGQGAGVQKGGLEPPAVSRGARNPLQPARTSALPEGAGGAVAGAGVTIGRGTEIRVSQEAISGPISKNLSTIFKPTVQRRWSTFCTTALFSGSAAVAAGHLVSADPQVRRVGMRERNRGNRTLYSGNSLVK